MLYRQLIVICLVVAAVAETPANKADPQGAAKSMPISISTTLADSNECKADIERYCTKNGPKRVGNLKALECIDDLDNAANLISKECQNRIYAFKFNMTRDVRFDKASERFCSKDINLLDQCKEEKDEPGTGRLISCLYDLQQNITDSTCRNFIQQIHSMIFADWRLSEPFTKACYNEIAELKCGRLDVENDTLPHDQGAVISCLSSKQKTLSTACSKQITQLTKIQSEDFHLDRALYMACREDRERFCPQVMSGSGRVYRCLYEQKFNTLMSTACRKEVHRRQKAVATNVLQDAPFLRVCRTEMREHNCVADPENTDQQLTLVDLLLCLEDRIKKGNQVKDECQREMLVHRRMLMSDYALSPELLSECKPEMKEHCAAFYKKGGAGTIDQRGGRMIHCLLKAAGKESNFSKTCLDTVKTFMRAVDPGSDVRADPLLETACRPVIDAACQRAKPGDSNIIMCLLDNLKNSRMTAECEDRLMEVAYFMARDWRLTPKLIRSCRDDLKKQCQLSANWTMNGTVDDAAVGKYLSCLYSQKQKLDSDCRAELDRLMRIRSRNVGLMPEIVDNCITDLATCKEPEVKGKEMKCLQDKYDNLDVECKEAVKKFTKLTMTDPSLDAPLKQACDPMVQMFCATVGSGKENEVIRCLIKHKNDAKMNFRCKSAIEHYQILSLKDSAFLSEQFQAKCKEEINDHCIGKSTKAKVIQCLANLALKDDLQKKNRIKETCREELKFELLQRSESINLDPLLAQACKADIANYCSAETPGNAQILDCLKKHMQQVSFHCFAKLKKRQKIDVVLPSNDFSLTSKCSSVIAKHCANEKKENILLCLRRHANDGSMPVVCRQVLFHRLMVLNTDVRFNKALVEACNNDIATHCSTALVDNDDDDDDDSDDADGMRDDGEEREAGVDRDLGGRVIECLRSKYANTNIQLDAQCRTELIDVIQASKIDIQFDVRLYQECKNVLRNYCPGADKEDCLRVLYQHRNISDYKCKLQVLRVIREGKADIHVDPSLLASCQVDVTKFCNDIPIGSGKQLQCLLKKRKSLAKPCKDMLTKRQELWHTISDVDDVDDLTRHIIHSQNSRYLYSVIFVGLLVIFLTGCVGRSCIRFRRVRTYK